MQIKKSFFYLIIILIPFLFLFLAEFILRTAGYGDDLGIVAAAERGGKKFYTMNQLVGKRYFDKERLYYRKGSHDFFEIEKQNNTLRIFCFGESTTAGFPFEYNATPAELIRIMLNNSLPDKNIEVINTAIAATNSFTVAEFAEELIKYQPDLYVIYLGQNEFYGAFGVGSAISVGKNRELIKTYLWLQKFKTFLLVKDIVSWFSGLFKNEEQEPEKLLMEQMAENNSISYNSSDYITAKENFKKNYEEIIETSKEHSIPVLISTLVTNEKDLAPFVSIYSEEISGRLKNERQNFYESGIEAKNNNDYKTAMEFFSRSAAVDSSAAIIHYEIAECSQKLGDYNRAKEKYILAKDLDGLRFRAPSDFNRIIMSLSKKHNIILADGEKSFRENSVHGIIGSDLLMDHVHPNIEGYFLLAKTWFNAIKKNNLFGIKDDVILNDSLLFDQAHITDLDRAIGKLKILKLKSGPPFTNEEKEFEFAPADPVEDIAYRYVIGQEMSWGSAHLQAAELHEKNKNFEKALKEYDAILMTDENNPFIIKLKGDIYYELKMYPKAEENYLQAYKLSDEPAIRYKLGLTSIIFNRNEAAVQLLKNCLVPQNTARFTPEELEDIRYNLAIAYKNLNINAYAVKELKIILRNNPSNKEAQKLLNTIEPR